MNTVDEALCPYLGPGLQKLAAATSCLLGRWFLEASHCANGKPKQSVKRRDPRGRNRCSEPVAQTEHPVPRCPPCERAVLEPPVQPVQPTVRSRGQLPPSGLAQIEGPGTKAASLTALLGQMSDTPQVPLKETPTRPWLLTQRRSHGYCRFIISCQQHFIFSFQHPVLRLPWPFLPRCQRAGRWRGP